MTEKDKEIQDLRIIMQNQANQIAEHQDEIEKLKHRPNKILFKEYNYSTDAEMAKAIGMQIMLFAGCGYTVVLQGDSDWRYDRPIELEYGFTHGVQWNIDEGDYYERRI